MECIFASADLITILHSTDTVIKSQEGLTVKRAQSECQRWQCPDSYVFL